jgi:hypothetical protein
VWFPFSLKRRLKRRNCNFISTGAAVSLIETGRQDTVLRVLEPAITLMVELQLKFERCSLGNVRHEARACKVGCNFFSPFHARHPLAHALSLIS